jgi:hypothetical protein
MVVAFGLNRALFRFSGWPAYVPAWLSVRFDNLEVALCKHPLTAQGSYQVSHIFFRPLTMPVVIYFF